MFDVHLAAAHELPKLRTLAEQQRKEESQRAILRLRGQLRAHPSRAGSHLFETPQRSQRRTHRATRRTQNERSDHVTGTDVDFPRGNNRRASDRQTDECRDGREHSNFTKARQETGGCGEEGRAGELHGLHIRGFSRIGFCEGLTAERTARVKQRRVFSSKPEIHSKYINFRRCDSGLQFSRDSSLDTLPLAHYYHGP